MRPVWLLCDAVLGRERKCVLSSSVTLLSQQEKAGLWVRGKLWKD